MADRINNSALPFFLIAWGQQYVDSGLAAILNSSAPLFTALLAVAFVVLDLLTPGRLGELMTDEKDDPAIWVHPTDKSQSLVIGNDKKGSLEVYDLDGNVVSGPPPKPLPRLPLKIEGEKLEIG